MKLIVNSLQPFGASGLGGLWYDVWMSLYCSSRNDRLKEAIKILCGTSDIKRDSTKMTLLDFLTRDISQTIHTYTNQDIVYLSKIEFEAAKEFDIKATKKVEIEKLQNENDKQAFNIQMLKNEVEILKKFISHTLNAKDKRIFNFKIDVAPLLLRFIFGLIWLHIFLHKDGFIAHAIIYAFQHYCM